MHIDEKLISYMEDLSFLTLSDEEKKLTAEDLEKILHSLTGLSSLNTDGIPECIQAFDKVNIFRNDEVRPFIDRELILKNAPVRNDEMFIAPKTVEN